MIHEQFLRIKKLKGCDIIKVAAKHNHREILAGIVSGRGSHIDSSRSHLNRVLCGPRSAADTASLAQTLMSDAGVKKLRKDAVQALEILFSIPISASAHQEAFFSDAIHWTDQYFGVPIISAIVHNDECAPHCHALLLPLLDGRMIGSNLVGNRSNLLAMQLDFYTKVAKKYGFRRPSPPARMNGDQRKRAAEEIFAALSTNSNLWTDPAIKPLLLEAFSKNPEVLTNALGLEKPKPPKPKKTFISIMTKPCKLEKSIGFG